MKKLYSILCLASLLLASCSQEQEDIQLLTQEKPVYLEVEVEPLSRATMLNDLPSECEYGLIYITILSKVNYVKGKSTIVDPIPLYDDRWLVRAFFPWDEENAAKILKEHGVWFSIYDDIDYLWGESTQLVNMYNPRATISFQHVFSYIDFVIQPNQYMGEALKKELIVDYIEVGQLPREVYFEFSGQNQLENFGYITLKGSGQSLSDGSVKLGTLCGPSKDTAHTWSDFYYKPVTIKIFFQGKDEPAEIEIPRYDWILEAGKKYTRYITINGRLEAELSETVSVTPWETGESQDMTVK